MNLEQLKKHISVLTDQENELFELLAKNSATLQTTVTERNAVYKQLKILETDIKVAEAGEVMSEEFSSYKNQGQRDAHRRLATETERRKRAELEGDLEKLNGAIMIARNERETVILQLKTLTRKAEHAVDLFRATEISARDGE